MIALANMCANSIAYVSLNVSEFKSRRISKDLQIFCSTTVSRPLLRIRYALTQPYEDVPNVQRTDDANEIQAILSNVKYTHQNDDLLRPSRVEEASLAESLKVSLLPPSFFECVS